MSEDTPALIPDGDHGTSFKMVGEVADIQIGDLVLHLHHWDDITLVCFRCAGYEDRGDLRDRIEITDEEIQNEITMYKDHDDEPNFDQSASIP